MFSAFQPVIYIQISPELLTLKNLKTGKSIAEIPEVAISMAPKLRILASGAQARLATPADAAKVLNPFAHPRSMVSNFTVAEQLIKHQLRIVMGGSRLSFAPYVVIHPLGSPDGGFTQVERRAFHEMALGAGASEVHVWTGRPLSDKEVIDRGAPQSGGIWD